ncbi:ribosome recycling factor [Peptococcaceae bacterium SCADC1_2_3]|nr:ribosome recycling factor [Peptococcaceae bacterium SCADC1_2_3]KFI37682.1 ribosome recycling factor [Peptococcaceae bacterium SCADC1_2_3]
MVLLADLDLVEDNMRTSIEVFKKELATFRTGRATPSLLEKVMVSYYGIPTPVNQVANISVPEARLLVIQPWERSILPEVERAILKSDLGINPTSDGSVIRLVIPQLTQERRLELVKTAKKRAEEGRVAVRNIRREANDHFKKQQKEGKISEDEMFLLQEKVQKLTDKYTKEIDQLVSNKEKEIMAV